MQSIAIDELLARADAGETLLLLDVRNDDAFAAWRLEARRPIETVHIPYFDFIEDGDAAIAKVPNARDVVVLCAKGGSSEMVTEMLLDAGRSARNVAGGMVAYGDHLATARVRTPPGFEIHQLNRRGKGCLSYLVRSGSEALVVDPSRAVDAYIDLARELGARIVRVLDTHVHADHVSGGRELARRAGAAFGAPAGRVRLGDIELHAVPAPGHTPESILVRIESSHLLTGDTLFVAGLGRPDLGGDAEGWGRALFDTLRTQVAPLADETVVLPAHFASSAEIGPDGVVCGRLGELRRRVPEMRIESEREFVAVMQATARPAPLAYQRIADVNSGRATATEDQISEWELGKNQCAMAAPAPSPKER